LFFNGPVAQHGSAPGWQSGGPVFKEPFSLKKRNVRERETTFATGLENHSWSIS